MNSGSVKKIALFVATDYIGLLVANRAIKALCAQGLEPVLFDIQTRLNRHVRTIAPPTMNHYVIDLFDKVVIPYLELNPFQDAANLTYRQLAQKYGLSYHAIQDVNDAETLSILDQTPGIAGGQSFRFPQVFSSGTIGYFTKKGFLWNMHGGLLPAYKGFLIPYRAIDNGEKEYGWTLHEIDAGIDTGCIIGTSRRPLDPDRSILNTYLDLVSVSTDMMVQALVRRSQGQVLPCAPHYMARDVSYYGYPTSQEMQRYTQRGIHFIDQPGHYIHGILDCFSQLGTPHADGLRDRLIQAVVDFERGQSTVSEIRSVDRVKKSA